METIVQMKLRRERERRAEARRARAWRIGTMLFMAVYITAASGILLHVISKAIEQAAYDAVQIEAHEW